MALTLAQIRAKYPQYADRSDEELATALYKREVIDKGKDMTEENFRSQIGMETIGKTGAVLQAIGQGGTFGFGDEIAAGIRTGLDRFTKEAMGIGDIDDDIPWSETYQRMLADQRGEVERAAREHPGLYTTAEIGTGVAQGLGGLGKAVGAQAVKQLPQAAAMTLRQAAPRAAGTGAALGGTAGYGYSEGDPIAALLGGGDVGAELGEAAGDAATGAGFGAALGGATPAVTSGISRIAGNIARRTGLAGGQEAAEAAARRDVMRELEREGLSIDDAARILDENPGMTIADLGPNMQQLTTDIAQKPGAGGAELRKFLEARDIGQFDRVIPELQQGLSQKHGQLISRNFGETEQKIMAQARTEVAPLYDEAYATPVRATAKLQELMARPSARSAYKRAVKEASDEGFDISKFGPEGATELNMARLDYTVRALQNRARATRISDPATSRRVGNIAREMLAEIEPQNRAFGRARAIYRGAKADEEALENGLRAFSDDADVLGMRLGELSDSERSNFSVGVLRAIERKMSRKVDRADMLRELRDTRHGREVLREVFGGEAKFNRFMKMMDAEKQMTQTANKALTGSPTFERLAKAGERGEQLGTLAGIAIGAKLGIPGLPFLVRKFGRRGAEALERADEFKRNQVATLLQQSNPQLLTRQLQAPPQMTGIGGLGAGAGAATALPGLLD